MLFENFITYDILYLLLMKVNNKSTMKREAHAESESYSRNTHKIG